MVVELYGRFLEALLSCIDPNLWCPERNAAKLRGGIEPPVRRARSRLDQSLRHRTERAAKGRLLPGSGGSPGGVRRASHNASAAANGRHDHRRIAPRGTLFESRSRVLRRISVRPL